MHLDWLVDWLIYWWINWLNYKLLGGDFFSWLHIYYAHLASVRFEYCVPLRGKREFLPSKKIGNFAGEGVLCIYRCKYGEEWFWPLRDSNLCKSLKKHSVNIEHWKKIKISMTYKEYELKIKTLQQQLLQLKMKILLD